MGSAVTLLRAVLRKGMDPEAAFHLGTLLAERGEPEGLEWLRAAVVAAPGDDAMLNNLGHALREAGRLDEAAAAFRRLLGRAPDLAAAHYGAGTVAMKQGRPGDAERFLAEACRLAPAWPLPLRLRADALEALERHAEALELLTRAAALDPRHAPTLRKLGLLHAFFGRKPLAVATLRQALSLAPGDPLATHMLGALTGEGGEHPDDAYVVALFDAFADSFDTHLVEVLGYRVPERVDAALPGPLGRVADLGCGTGLLGPRLRGRCDHLVGVDLSPAMVARAAARGVYDELVVGGIVPWLEAAEGVWDTILLADVLVYVGALGPTFAGLRRALAPGGRVALTTEAHPGEGVVLLPNGRYAHGAVALGEAASAAGLRVVHCARERLRKEGGRWVEGELALLEAM